MKKIIISILTIFIIFFILFVYRNSGNPYVRIENASDYVFDEVIVNFRGEEINYGKILNKNKTDYKKIKKAYWYAYIRVKVIDHIYKIQPKDYVGESRLPRGRYAYILMFNPNEDQYNALKQRVFPKKKNMIDYYDIQIRSFYNKYFGKWLGYI